MNDLQTAAQQALDSINELFTAEQSEGGERSGHIRTPATREHLVRIAQARKALHESCGALRAALAQQAEPVEVAERERVASQWDGCVTHQLDTFGPVDIGASIRAGELVEAQQTEPVDADAAYQRWLADTHAPALRRMDSQGAFAAGWKAALAQQDEPVEPVAWKQGNLVTFNKDPYPALGSLFVQFWDGEEVAARVYANDHETLRQRCAKINTAPPQRKLVPLTEEEILAAVGWERAEMYMKLTPNFPVDEAKKETLTNARAVEKASWEKNHG